MSWESAEGRGRGGRGREREDGNRRDGKKLWENSEPDFRILLPMHIPEPAIDAPVNFQDS